MKPAESAGLAAHRDLYVFGASGCQVISSSHLREPILTGNSRAIEGRVILTTPMDYLTIAVLGLTPPSSTAHL
jgi:hypothetical protein